MCQCDYCGQVQYYKEIIDFGETLMCSDCYAEGVDPKNE